MLHTRRLTVPAALTVALFLTSCDGNTTTDAGMDTNNNGVARCDTPDSSTSCAACYNANGDMIIDCNSCLGPDGLPHVEC